MLSWQNYTEFRQEKILLLKGFSTSLPFEYEQLVSRVKISYSPRPGGMKRKLGPCERGCGVRPLMVTDDVYGWLRKRTKWSKSREKGITRVLFRRKTTSFSGILVEQERLLFFSPTVSGDGPINLFPLQASICACAWSFFSLTAVVVPNKVVQKRLNVPYIHF